MRVKGRDESPRRRAEGYLERLEAKYAPRALGLALRNAPVRLRPALVEALIARAVEHRLEAPQETLLYAGYAVGLAEQLGGEAPPGLLARAYAELGNALRIHERFSEARLPFRKAKSALVGASPETRAEVLSLYASLLHRIRKCRAAAAVLRKVRAIYRGEGRTDDETRILVQLGGLLVDAGRIEESRRALDVAIRRLHATPGPPALHVAAYNNVLYGLIEEAAVTRSPAHRAALIDQALVGTLGVKPFFDRHATPTQRLHLEWSLGRLLLVEGKLEAARVQLDGLVGAFLEHDKPFSAAASALDLCLVLARKRQAPQLRAAASAALAMLQGQQLHEDLWLALNFLRSAKEMKAAEALILKTLERCGAPSFGAPRSLDPN